MLYHLCFLSTHKNFAKIGILIDDRPVLKNPSWAAKRSSEIEKGGLRDMFNDKI